MKKKSQKKLRLNTETLAHLDMTSVNGGASWSCPETRAFTGCEFCTETGGTRAFTTCEFCTDSGVITCPVLG